MHHVFVDGENVHQVDSSVLPNKPVSLTWLLGRTSKLDTKPLEALMERAGMSVQLVRLTSTGKNALDMTLAYYVGRAVLTDPTGSFHVISKDQDFAPLIEHLRQRGIKALRHDDFSKLGASASGAKPSPAAVPLVDRVAARLRKHPKKRPTTLKALRNWLHNAGLNASEAEISAVIDDLCQRKKLNIGQNGAVEYCL